MNRSDHRLNMIHGQRGGGSGFAAHVLRTKHGKFMIFSFDFEMESKPAHVALTMGSVPWRMDKRQSPANVLSGNYFKKLHICSSSYTLPMRHGNYNDDVLVVAAEPLAS